jgi:hypothetical protein
MLKLDCDEIDYTRDARPRAKAAHKEKGARCWKKQRAPEN